MTKTVKNLLSMVLIMCMMFSVSSSYAAAATKSKKVVAKKATTQVVVLPTPVIVPRKYKEGTMASDVVYSKVNDKDLKLDIYFPRSYVLDKSPVIVYVHGGYWFAGDKKADIPALAPNINKLRDKGFTVVSVDYRLVNGDTIFPAPVNDIKSAITYLRANANEYGLDANKIGLMGVSAGGHLALMQGLTDDSVVKPKFIISIAGPTDLTVAKSESQKSLSNLLMGSNTSGLSEFYNVASPVFFVAKTSPPVLLIHGDKDTIVPISQSNSLLEKGKLAGADINMITVAGGGHNLSEIAVQINPTIDDIGNKIVEFAINKFNN